MVLAYFPFDAYHFIVSDLVSGKVVFGVGYYVFGLDLFSIIKIIMKFKWILKDEDGRVITTDKHSEPLFDFRISHGKLWFLIPFVIYILYILFKLDHP